MKITIKLKQEDWNSFQSNIKQSALKTIKNRFNSFWFNLVLWAVIAFVFLTIFENYSSLHWPSVVSTALFFVLLIALNIYNTKILYTAYEPLEDGILLGDHTFEINKLGIKSTGKGYESLHSWDMVKNIMRTKENVLVFLDTTYAFIFPMRELENPEEFYEYINELHKKHNKSI
jgi:hypothetical protein